MNETVCSNVPRVERNLFTHRLQTARSTHPSQTYLIALPLHCPLPIRPRSYQSLNTFQRNNIAIIMRFALSLLLAAAGTYRAVDAFVPRTNLMVPTERIGSMQTTRTTSQLAVSTGSLPEIDINKLDSIDSSALSSLLLGEENSTDRLLKEFTAWAQPQVEALADYGVYR